MNENDELNDVLANEKTANLHGESSDYENEPAIKTAARRMDVDEPSYNVVQWTTSDNRTFFPASRSVPILKPGLYEIKVCQSRGIYFERNEVNNEHLIRFPDSNIDKVISDIEKFWMREEIFRSYELTFKRGILLWGPPGTGKTSAIRLIMEDVIKREGVVIKFNNPNIFEAGAIPFRMIQPDTPCVVLMEDMDSILEQNNESSVINILDGVSKFEKVVFIATTNYPERLGARIVNRPSRFDKRYKIGHLNPESRKLYFEHLFSRRKTEKVDIAQWVKDTDKLSVAHLKELFISVIIMGESYENAIETIRGMKDVITTNSDARIGFK